MTIALGKHLPGHFFCAKDVGSVSVVREDAEKVHVGSMSVVKFELAEMSGKMRKN